VRIGIITDVHLAPAGHPPAAFHNPYALEQAGERFQRALKRCVLAGTDIIAMLGDLSHLGDEESLTRGIALAAASRRPVWMVPGNHDLGECDDALPRAIARAGAAHVRLAPAAGVELGGTRLAGVGLARGAMNGGFRANATSAGQWGYGRVLLLSHFPLLSLREQADLAALKYAGDLEELAGVVTPIRQRPAPTIVVHGHLHLGHVMACGPILQISCAPLVEPPHAVTLLQLESAADGLVVRRYESLIAPDSTASLPHLSAADQTWRFAAGAWSQSAKLLVRRGEPSTFPVLVAE
jgi:hypothetical protein